MKRYIPPFLFLLLVVIRPVAASQETPSLKFLLSGIKVNELTLDELKSKLSAYRLEFYDPQYGKVKRYKAFSLRDVLRLGFGDKTNGAEYTDIAFTALDGYEAIASLSKLKEKGGYVVFSDLDYENWEPVGRKSSSPGPFYLVWTGEGQSAQKGYPWPWQIKSMNIMRFEDQYPLVYPEGADRGSPEYKGYEIFKARCVRCHSMNGQGGKVGPDLNAPKSIVTYRPEYMIKEFIKHPSKYRYTQMPDHPDLTDNDIESIIEYFRYMNRIKH